MLTRKDNRSESKDERFYLINIQNTNTHIVVYYNIYNYFCLVVQDFLVIFSLSTTLLDGNRTIFWCIRGTLLLFHLTPVGITVLFTGIWLS
jgi:hypothetical protein